MSLQAVLLDLGGPILDETAEYARWGEFLVEALAQAGFAVPKEQFQTAVEEEIAHGDPNPWLAAVWRFVRPNTAAFRAIRSEFRALQERLWVDLSRKAVRPEAAEAILRLALRYRLALAANQPRVTLNLLEQAGLLHHFAWREVSETMGVSKPAPLFFRMILDGLGVEPAEAVMVGDRLDLDVYPAKLLGMKAVRVLTGPYAGQLPLTPWHVPEHTVASLSEVPAALARLGG